MLYGNTGGKSLKLLTASLLRYGQTNPVTAVDPSDLDGIGPVCFERPQGGQQAALAMNQDTFKSLYGNSGNIDRLVSQIRHLGGGGVG